MKPQCPCQSGNFYETCCEPFLSCKKTPPDPLSLMRSRYTAWTQINIGYLKNTMKGQALTAFDPKSARQWAKTIQWTGLNIIESTLSESSGTVEFIATFKEKEKNQTLHELSQFQRVKGRWYYVDGEHQNGNLS